MDIYASDEEKGEEIKQWWRDNGRSVVVIAVFTLIAIFSGRYWLEHQASNALKASQLYQQVSMSLNSGDITTADSSAEILFANFANTPYAVFSSLDMAAKSVSNQDYTSAQSYLKWVIANANLAAHQELAQLRLAQVFLLEKKYDEALLEISKASTSTEFASLWLELKGDIYIAQSEPALARGAYLLAISSLNQGEPRQQILQIKLDDVAASTNV
jgi:predicted negative regulator of RcsB-dependent stress response